MGIKAKPEDVALYQAGIDFRNKLITRETETIQALLRVYAKAYQSSHNELLAVENEIKRLLASGYQPSVVMTMMRNRYNNALEIIEDRVVDLAGTSAFITMSGQKSLIDIVKQSVGVLIQVAVGKNPKTDADYGVSQLSLEQLDVLAGFMGDGSPLKSYFESMGESMASEIEAVLVDAITTGKSPIDAAQRIRTLATEMPMWQAERIARTELMRVAREATRIMYDNDPVVTGYRRMATQDLRVCPGCLALSGKLHKTNQLMASHPNCRCVMVPETLSWGQITGDPSLDATKPQVPNGDNLLSGMTEREQKIILGDARFNKWKNGTPLEKMVQVRDNPKWGPEIRLVPVADL